MQQTGKTAYRLAGLPLYRSQLLSNMWIIDIPGSSSDMAPCGDECGSCMGDGNDDDGFWPRTGIHTLPQIFSE